MITITLTNPNPGALTNVTFTDNLPTPLQIASPVTTGGTCGGTFTNGSGATLVTGDTSFKITGGSTTVEGHADPSCPNGMNVLKVYDCGPDVPPICHDGNDVLIGTGHKDASGHFVIAVFPPLRPGELIYVVDMCFDPPVVGPPVLVQPPIPAPLLGPTGIGTALALLLIVGARGLRRAARR